MSLDANRHQMNNLFVAIVVTAVSGAIVNGIGADAVAARPVSLDLPQGPYADGNYYHYGYDNIENGIQFSAANGQPAAEASECCACGGGDAQGQVHSGTYSYVTIRENDEDYIYEGGPQSAHVRVSVNWTADGDGFRATVVETTDYNGYPSDKSANANDSAVPAVNADDSWSYSFDSTNGMRISANGRKEGIPIPCCQCVTSTVEKGAYTYRNVPVLYDQHDLATSQEIDGRSRNLVDLMAADNGLRPALTQLAPADEILDGNDLYGY